MAGCVLTEMGEDEVNLQNGGGTVLLRQERMKRWRSKIDVKGLEVVI